MNVTVRLFAALRERAGADSVSVDLPEGACVADVLKAVEPWSRGASIVVAVNREYATPDTPVAEGDEIAAVPPVSGGAVTEDPLSIDGVAGRVADPRAGAIVTFSGVTRDVEHLDYQAYKEMAAERIDQIVADAIVKHGLLKAAADHRTGRVARGEPSVVVAASAAHRPEAFAGAREIIDRIKAEAPIFKREAGQWREETVPPLA